MATVCRLVDYLEIHVQSEKKPGYFCFVTDVTLWYCHDHVLEYTLNLTSCSQQIHNTGHLILLP